MKHKNFSVVLSIIAIAFLASACTEPSFAARPTPGDPMLNVITFQVEPRGSNEYLTRANDIGPWDTPVPPSDGQPLLMALEDSLLVQISGSSSCPPIISSVTLASDGSLSIMVDDLAYQNQACTYDLVPHLFRLTPESHPDPLTEAQVPVLMQQIAGSTSNYVFYESQKHADGTVSFEAASPIYLADTVVMED